MIDDMHGPDEPVTAWTLANAEKLERITFTTKDSGERVDFPSGMRRDTDKGKARYDLIPRFMLTRLAELYARGAVKYGEDNYTLADSDAELTRFKASAFRHFIAWIDGERDEDHGAAVFFNITAAEMVGRKLDEKNHPLMTGKGDDW